MKRHLFTRSLGLLGLVAMLAISAAASTSSAMPPDDRWPQPDERPGHRPGHPGRPGYPDRPERYVLDLFGQEFNSQQGEDTVPLKRLLMSKYGQIGLQHKQLARVVVFAKSKFGRGQMQLLVGDSISYPQTIYGNPQDYHHQGGYYRYVFDNPGGYSHGVWQLKMQGNIRIDRIAVVVRDLYR